MSDCARGCTNRGQHVTDCLCTNDCPPHGAAHCDGCFPRAADVGHYCQRCADQFRDALDAIPELVTQIAQYPKVVSKATDVKGSSTTVNPPSLSPAWDLADEVIQWASDWAWIVAGRPTFDPIPYNNAGLPMRDLTTTINHIRIRLTQVLSDDDDQLYNEATTYHHRLINAAGSDMTRRIKTPCPRCAQRSIVVVIRGGQVECRNTYCLTMWTPLEWGHVTNRVAYMA